MWKIKGYNWCQKSVQLKGVVLLVMKIGHFSLYLLKFGGPVTRMECFCELHWWAQILNIMLMLGRHTELSVREPENSWGVVPWKIVGRTD